ncbi:DNA cytosine methyltransferase, partial [Thalassorhabdus alkalitolerans]
MAQVKVLSLFSGAGGLDIGFVKAGFDVLCSIEYEEKFTKTLEANKDTFFKEDHQIICEDINKVTTEAINQKHFDLIIGGPPCQSFSAAGRRAGGVYGISDTRGSLFGEFCRFIDHYKPKGFLFENVRGLLQANKKKDWDIIRNSFQELGYEIHFRILDAADYGVPQHRERLIM